MSFLSGPKETPATVAATSTLVALGFKVESKSIDDCEPRYTVTNSNGVPCLVGVCAAQVITFAAFQAGKQTARRVKKFIIQFEEGADTKWQFPDDAIAREIQLCAEVTANAATTGTVPRVTVVRDESFEVPLCANCNTYHNGPCTSEATASTAQTV